MRCPRSTCIPLSQPLITFHPPPTPPPCLGISSDSLLCRCLRSGACGWCIDGRDCTRSRASREQSKSPRYGRRAALAVDANAIDQLQGGKKNCCDFAFFIYFYLTYSRCWTSTLPTYLWSLSLRIFPSVPGSRLTIFFYRDASSALLQLGNQWLNFTYSRSHAFRDGRNM